MAIGLARLEGLASLLEGARRMHAVTRFQHLPFSEPRRFIVRGPDGHAARLLMAFEGRCKNRGVKEIAFGTNSVHDERNLVGRFAVKAGYERVGENYLKPTARALRATGDKE